MSTTFQKVDAVTAHIETIETTVQAIAMEAVQEKELVARAMGRRQCGAYNSDNEEMPKKIQGPRPLKYVKLSVHIAPFS
jgi:hypothetical protein